MKSDYVLRRRSLYRRSPCGERGLKWLAACRVSGSTKRRSPCGERGLKYAHYSTNYSSRRRSPCGERGLKCPALRYSEKSLTSLPVRGAWIEISGFLEPQPPHPSSLPVRGAWIEIHLQNTKGVSSRRSPCGERGLKFPETRIWKNASMSLPVRGAWIEMIICTSQSSRLRVAPRAGSVD